MPRPRKPASGEAESPQKEKVPSKTAKKAVAPVSSPNPGMLENMEDEIRQRAYEIYEDSGREDGLAQEHWLQAEREVLARRGRTA